MLKKRRSGNTTKAGIAMQKKVGSHIGVIYDRFCSVKTNYDRCKSIMQAKWLDIIGSILKAYERGY